MIRIWEMFHGKIKWIISRAKMIVKAKRKSCSIQKCCTCSRGHYQHGDGRGAHRRPCLECSAEQWMSRRFILTSWRIRHPQVLEQDGVLLLKPLAQVKGKASSAQFTASQGFVGENGDHGCCGSSQKPWEIPQQEQLFDSTNFHWR